MKKELIPKIAKFKKAPGFKPFEGGVAKYSVAFQTGKEVVNVVNGNTACHAGLRYPNQLRLPNAKPVAIFNSICSVNVDDKVALRFLEWFFNYSPYHEAWHTKSAKVALKSGIMVGNTDVPANLVCGAMFASRSIWEHKARVATIWNAFVERGLHPDIAFMLGHYYGVYGDDKIQINPIYWHVPIHGDITPAHILNFMTGNRKDTKTYEEIQTYEYGSIHATWKKANAKAKGITLPHEQWLGEVGKEEKKTINVFKLKEQAAAKVVRLDAATEYLTPLYKEKFKKWI